MKLVHPEPETPALIAALASHEAWVASEIVEVEAVRAARRRGGEPLVSVARRQLERLSLLPATDAIRARAADLEPRELRTLDALHLATALEVRARLATFYAYDARLAHAARGVGLRVGAPA